ncbi:hypothetical protein ACLFLH_04705 [Mammaliicoccus sciuri]|uniref:hypothetical protein n=1 Tax=Mammaliicoccus sciuri TaxID=1296 RepID=UPI00397A9209
MTEEQFQNLYDAKSDFVDDLVFNDDEFLNTLYESTVSNFPNLTENEQRIMTQMKARDVTTRLLIQELFKAILVDE